MATRLYIVTENATGKVRLIDANSQTQALLHAAKPAWTVSAASPKDVAAAMAGGAAVEYANAQPTTEIHE